MKYTVMACWVIMALCVVTMGIAGEESRQDIEAKDTSNARILPFRDGYCSVVGPLAIVAKAGAEIEFGPEIEYKGKKFQIQKPISTNAYSPSSISVQILTKTKEPSGPASELKSDSQNWNEKQKTVDFRYGNRTIQVIVHMYARAMGGFVIKDIECLPPTKGK